MSHPATHTQVVKSFLAIPYDRLTSYNWGLAPPEDRAEWNVNEETYINGIILTLDLDYRMGYLIETVDRTTKAISYFVIVTGPYQEHDSMMYEGRTGTFFEREVELEDITEWGLSRMHGLLESMEEAKSHHD